MRTCRTHSAVSRSDGRIHAVATRLLHHREALAELAGRPHDRPGGRREPRERGRPRHRRREGHARGDQLHDPQRPAASSAWRCRRRHLRPAHLEPQPAVNLDPHGHAVHARRSTPAPASPPAPPPSTAPAPSRSPSTTAPRPHDLVRGKGHVDGLRARDGGVLVRAGHTEGSVDLARLAGLKEAAVICEIVNADGHMARLPDLQAFCEKHGLKMCTIEDLIKYRRPARAADPPRAGGQAADRATASST